MRKLQCRERLGIDQGTRSRKLSGCDPNACQAQIDAVISLSQIDQRRIALLAYAGDDRGDLVVDVGGLFALQSKQSLEAVLEIGAAASEPQGHGAALRSRSCRARRPRRIRRPRSSAQA